MPRPDRSIATPVSASATAKIRLSCSPPMRWASSADINAHHPGTLREIGNNLLGLRFAAEAVPWYRAAIEASPVHPFLDEAYLGIAEAELEQDHIHAAVSAASNSVRHDHWGSLAGFWLAAVLEIAGRHSEAKDVLAEFYRQHPEYPTDSDIAVRLVNLRSVHPRMILGALHRLGVAEIHADSAR